MLKNIKLSASQLKVRVSIKIAKKKKTTINKQ